MNIKFSKSESGNNKGSVTKLVDYLGKENTEKDQLDKRFFFSHTEDKVISYEVIEAIDNNHYKLGKKDAKFYMITINPSEKELKHIGCDESAMMEYSRKVMDEYAKNFNKGLVGKNLVYFGMLEEHRRDRKTKIPKHGLNWHVHIIVSRKDRTQRLKLSPLSNHRKNSKGPINGGFDRNQMRQKSQTIFDKMFNYERHYKDTFEYQNGLKNGSIETQVKVMKKLNTFLYTLKSLAMTNNNQEIDEEELEKRKRKGFEI